MQERLKEAGRLEYCTTHTETMPMKWGMRGNTYANVGFGQTGRRDLGNANNPSALSPLLLLSHAPFFFFRK